METIMRCPQCKKTLPEPLRFVVNKPLAHPEMLLWGYSGFCSHECEVAFDGGTGTLYPGGPAKWVEAWTDSRQLRAWLLFLGGEWLSEFNPETQGIFIIAEWDANRGLYHQSAFSFNPEGWNADDFKAQWFPPGTLNRVWSVPYPVLPYPPKPPTPAQEPLATPTGAGETSEEEKGRTPTIPAPPGAPSDSGEDSEDFDPMGCREGDYKGVCALCSMKLPHSVDDCRDIANCPAPWIPPSWRKVSAADLKGLAARESTPPLERGPESFGGDEYRIEYDCVSGHCRGCPFCAAERKAGG